MSKLGITTIILTLTLLLSAVSAKRAPAPAPVEAQAPGPVSDFGPAASGPTPGGDCLTPVSNMSDCLGYVTPGSNLTVPDKNCCPELAGLIESHVVCLCQLLSGGVAKQFGISIDMGRALKLPAVCKIDTPSVTLCSAVGYPVAAPANSPSSKGPSTSFTAPASESPAGLAASPSAREKDAASSNTGSAFVIFGGLAFSFLSTLL